MKTIITQYSEKVTYAQANLLLNIFSQAAKYKIYAMVLNEILDNKDEKVETLTAKIVVNSESIVRNTQISLNSFVYGKKHLSHYLPKGNWVEEMGMEIGELFAKKDEFKSIEIESKALRLEIKDILSKYFDSITITT